MHGPAPAARGRLSTAAHNEKNRRPVSMTEINPDRLWATLQASAEIGRWLPPGLQRLALSDADRDMRDTFCGWCRQSGYSVRVDQVGNIFARRDGTEEIEPVLVGSHLDTQVAGGRYDGILGVLSGLEVLRFLDDSGARTRRPVEVVSWSNEEGARFSPPMLGSAAYAGALPLHEALATKDDADRSFGDELVRIGYAGTEPVPGPRPSAYFELHIEQDDFLDRSGINLGIVTAARSVRGFLLKLTGETSHSGATPMRRRRDAFIGAAELAVALDAMVRTDGDDVRGSVPRIDVWPNRPGIVPGEATLTFDFRHGDPSALESMLRRVEEIVADICERRQLSCSWLRSWRFGEEIAFDAGLAATARQAAADLGIATADMASWAGHDAYWLATIAPALILFTPCVGGVSHNEKEDIEFDRVIHGVSVLARSVLLAANR